MRRVAELAGSSTWASTPCSVAGPECWRRSTGEGSSCLRARLVTAFDHLTGPAAHHVSERIVAIALAYRRFALDNPALYALYVRATAARFGPVAAASGRGARHDASCSQTRCTGGAAGLVAGDDPVRPAYLLWTTMHGIHEHRAHPCAARTRCRAGSSTRPTRASGVYVDGVHAHCWPAWVSDAVAPPDHVRGTRHSGVMEAIDLLLLALGMLVGAALGALAVWSRSAGGSPSVTPHVERDRLRAERDAVTQERAAVEAIA